MTLDLQVAARQFRALIDAPSQAVGVLGWGIDGEPRIRVFADAEWLRIGAPFPQQYAGYRIEVQVRTPVQAYIDVRCQLPARASAGYFMWCT